LLGLSGGIDSRWSRPWPAKPSVQQRARRHHAFALLITGSVDDSIELSAVSVSNAALNRSATAFHVLRTSWNCPSLRLKNKSAMERAVENLQSRFARQYSDDDSNAENRLLLLRETI